MIGMKYRNALPPQVAREFDQLLAGLRAFLSVSFNSDGTLITTPAASVSEAGLPVGAIVEWPTATAPNSNWLLCDGSAVSRATYSGLFAAIGTTFGAGDSVTTFNVPDFRGRFALGKAAAGTGSTLGSTGGTIDHVHSGPSHTHPIASQATATTASQSVSVTGVPSATVVVAAGVGTTVATDTHTHSDAHTHTVPAHDHGAATDAAGAGNTGTANPPYVVVNYIILAQ